MLMYYALNGFKNIDYDIADLTKLSKAQIRPYK